MHINKHFVHSMIWLTSSVLSSSTMLACKQREQEQTTTTTSTDAKQAEQERSDEKADEKTDSPAAKAEPPAQPVDVPEKVAPPVDEQLVTAAREVAAAMGAAASALDANDAAKAKAELANATAALARIEANRPSVGIVVELWRTHRELGVEETAGAVDTIPLLMKVSRVDIPVYNREEIQAQHEQRKTGAPGSATKQDKLTDLRIIESNLIYHEVDLPMAASEIAVIEAQRLLDEGKPEEAKAALTRGIESVRVVDAIVEAPEFRARQLIWDAENALSRGQRDEARQLLDKAQQLLGQGAQSEADPAAKQLVTTLLDEMKPLQDALTAGTTGDEHVSAFRRISRSALDLARRAALRVELSRHHQQDRFALVDALTWLEAARTQSFLRPDSYAVMRDLEVARAALRQAAEVAPSSAKPNLDDLQARINHLIELDSATPRDRKQIDAELRDVIFDLRMLMFDLQVLPTSERQQTQ